MGEPVGTKQVRVDNWGVFFLQRLQLFFSKTDYCDLTLQFEGNVQLKVHRLVMNACTEYFSFLEQTCHALEENTILMPSDMQADVIVPIVNFMYTGMLEFHFSVFEKIYKAAETMNITILVKILEAQIAKPTGVGSRRKTEVSNSFGQARKPSPKNSYDFGANKKQSSSYAKRRAGSSTAHPVSATFNEKWSVSAPAQDPLSLPDNTPKPTRFEWPDDDLPTINLMDISFDEISYTSKPLLTREEEQRAGPSFDDVRNTAVNNRKKPSISESSSTLNTQEIEDFYIRDQKNRPDTNVFDPEEIPASPVQGVKRKTEYVRSTSSPKRVKPNAKEANKEATLNVKTYASTEIDHTKIVSEILKKYPGLVKKNKNIKLKIMATPPNKSINPEQLKSQAGSTKKVNVQVSPPPSNRDIKTEPVVPPERREVKKVSEEGPWTCTKCMDGEPTEFVLYYLYRKHMSDVHNEVFDKKYCKYCGKFCSTDTLMAYHLYTKHGLKPQNNMAFPRCGQCPYIAISEKKMLQHRELHGPEEVQCSNCKLGFMSRQHLNTHIQLSGHPNKNNVNIIDCAYCMKKLQSGVNLLNHVKTQHFKEGRRDGVICLEENLEIDDPLLEGQEEEEQENDNRHAEDQEDEESEYVLPVGMHPPLKKGQLIHRDKVKIISDVKVPSQHEDEDENAEPPRQLDPSSEAEALNNVASGIATSLGLVDIVVLDDNQQYILQQQQNQNDTEFILPELSSGGAMLQAGQDLNSTDELVMVLADQDYPDGQNPESSDNSNIVVLYSHPVDGHQGQFITSQGNLMVNSQTGMLEIRNGGAIATTTASQIMSVNNAHDSPGESIELIQREIDSHATHEIHVEPENKETAAEHELTTEPVSQEEEEVEPKETATEVQVNITQEEGEDLLNKSVDSADVTTGSADVTDSTEDHYQPEPMDIDQEQVCETLVTVERIDETDENEPRKMPSEEGRDIPPDVAENPTSELENPASELENHTSEAVNPTSEPENPTSELENPTSELETVANPTSEAGASVLYTEGGNAVILNDIDHANTSGEGEGTLILNDFEEDHATDGQDNMMEDIFEGPTSTSHEAMEVDGAEKRENFEEKGEITGKNEEVTTVALEAEVVPNKPEMPVLEPQVQQQKEENLQISENQESLPQEYFPDLAVEDIPLPPEPPSEVKSPNEPPRSNLKPPEIDTRPPIDEEVDESRVSREPDEQEDFRGSRRPGKEEDSQGLRGLGTQEEEESRGSRGPDTQEEESRGSREPDTQEEESRGSRGPDTQEEESRGSRGPDTQEEESRGFPGPDTQEEEEDVVRRHEETRTPAEINRTILADWGEDTDSQSSEKQKSVAVSVSVNKEAVENVNKLMDDWDEEEEEDRRKE